jgi:hypothetical protein
MMNNPVDSPQQIQNKNCTNQPQNKNNPKKPTIIQQTFQSQALNPNKNLKQERKEL